MRRALLAAAAAGALVLALTGCSPTVDLAPAPQATTVACAGIVARVATQPLGALQPRKVDAQGTAAWGDPLAVTMFCGVASRPSDDVCYPYDGVDWKEHNTPQKGVEYEVYTTVGRSPSVQFWVDDNGSANDALPALSAAVNAATARSGIGCTVPGASTPRPSPVPTPSP